MTSVKEIAFDVIAHASNEWAYNDKIAFESFVHGVVELVHELYKSVPCGHCPEDVKDVKDV